jgi:hypothetical protein
VVGWLAVQTSAPLPRRAVLRGGAALLAAAAAGCDLLPGATSGAGPAPEPDPDVVLADEAAARERRLLAAYDAALVRDPALAERLAPLRAEHAAHLAALGVADPPGPSASPAPAVPSPPLPAAPGALLPALADLERTTSTAHAGAAVRSGRGLAAVLASLAASEASHVVALG